MPRPTGISHFSTLIIEYLVGVDASAQLNPAAKERLESLLKGGHSGASADEDNVRHVSNCQRRVLEHGRHGVDAPGREEREGVQQR